MTQIFRSDMQTNKQTLSKKATHTSLAVTHGGEAEDEQEKSEHNTRKHTHAQIDTHSHAHSGI